MQFHSYLVSTISLLTRPVSNLSLFLPPRSLSHSCSYVERLLDRISNGVLAEDRRNAMVELESVVSESRAAQLAFGAMGFPVVLSILKEERDDLEMVCGALETPIRALTPIDHTKGPKNEVQPALMNSDLLSREVDSISLLLSLLSDEDFYVRYYTLQLITALLTNSPSRVQEAILTIPGGMDMLMDREVIRNEASLLLTYLTLEAEKILVFEGAFEKIFSIIKEEGSSDGGVVVQDCLELLNYLLRNNTSNQKQWALNLNINSVAQRKQLQVYPTKGSKLMITNVSLPSGLKCYLPAGQAIILLGVLETIQLLVIGGPEADAGKDTNRLTNKTVLVQALQCIGELIAGHSENRDSLASKVLGDEPHKNPDGQTMLASTLIPQPQLMTHAPSEDDVHMSFGSMLLRGLTMSESNGDLETSCKAASILSHILKDDVQCKERVLKIELEAPIPSFGGSEPLMHRMVKYLALSSSMKNSDGKSSAAGNAYVQPVILKLLGIGCSAECVIYNKSNESGRDALSIADTISQKIELTSHLLKFDEMQKSLLFTSAKPTLSRKPLTQSSVSSMTEIEDVDENEAIDQKNDHPMLVSTFDSQFVYFVKHLEGEIRDKTVEIYSHPKSQVAGVPAELEQRNGETDVDYIKRLRTFVEIQDLLSRNATLAEDLSRTGGNGSSELEHSGAERVQVETLKRDIQEASQRLEMLKTEKTRIESEASMYRNLAGTMEADLKSLSDAYNSLEQTNFHLENEVKSLSSGGSIPIPDVETLKAEAREEAQKESEAELNDLLVCLGQEQTKVERLSARLMELGEDVEKLLEGIGDDTELPEDDEEDED